MNISMHITGALKQAVQECSIWKIKLKLCNGLHVTSSVLQHYYTEATLQSSNLSSFFIESYIIQAIKKAYGNMRSHQKNHKMLCESYLKGLAEAIVLHHQSPYLDSPETTPARKDRTLK
jgi:hypothetical protein